MTDSAFLRFDWSTCFDDLGLAEPDPAVYVNLLTRYAEPHRAYHTARHISECFEKFEIARGLARNPGSVAAALWFHDAIYDTGRHDNEELSAALADEVLAGVRAAKTVRTAVRKLILVTRHDAVPADNDARLMVDIDLSILGALPRRFDEYEDQVRIEYQSVPEDAFRTGRAKILRQFLARDRIFNTDFFKKRYEARARSNLKRSVLRLVGGLR